MIKTIRSIKTEGNITALEFTPTLKELQGLVEIKFESTENYIDSDTVFNRYKLMKPIIVEGTLITHVCEWKSTDGSEYEIASYGSNDEVFDNKEIESGYEVSEVFGVSFDTTGIDFSYVKKGN